MSQQAMQPLTPVHGTASLTFRNTLATQRNGYLILIDFSAINAFNKGQRESFEELICVLAERAAPEGALEFQHNDGCGGDGGVEALWILNDGVKVGYQAKFFLTIGDPQWRQMDESVEQALNVHPELKTYVFALPRDLTPDRGGKGKSGRQKWDARVIKWKALAEKKSINIEFVLWSETTLKEMLLREENSFLIKYWFGGDVLNDTWFEHQIDVAKQALDDRFNPDDHVEVSIEDLFDTIARGSSITKQFRSAFIELENSKVPSYDHTYMEHLIDSDELLTVNSVWVDLVELKDIFSHDFTKEWDTALATSVLNRLDEEIWNILEKLSSKDTRNLSAADQNKVKKFSQNLRNIISSNSTLRKIFHDPNLQAESQRCAVVYGPAGAGKSHILGQVAVQRTCAGLPTVLVLGQSLSKSIFWEQIGSVLGLEGRTADDVLGVLNAAGVHKGERTILLFDAINEGVGSQYWLQNLPEIVNAIQRYSHLAAIFSCRDEYLPYAVPETLSEKLPKFLIKGFSSPEELERAAIKYLDGKGIARPNTPWLSPEFSNPLFLKSASEALHAKGLTEFPRGLNGISQIMALYLDALSWRTGIETINPDAISGSIKMCVRLVADKMATDGCDFIEIEEAIAFAESSFKARTAPEGKTWLQVLVETSLFRRDPPPYSECLDPFNPPSELIRFSFQRFQDHLMATSLISKVAVSQTSLAFNAGYPLNFLFYNGQLDDGLDYKYAGLVSALSTIYPEKFEVEFAKTLPDWERHWNECPLLQEGFGESFKWRSTRYFSDSTHDLLSGLNEYHVEYRGLILEVSMTIDHPYNALYLHSRLKLWSMPERDSNWTCWVNYASREEFNQVERIVSWSLSIRDSLHDVKHLELASVILAWSLSSSHMTLRDRATKALTTLFLANTGIFSFVIEKMHDCDDPYIMERVYAAAFGACCIDQNVERLTDFARIVFSKVFANKKPPVALLTRDYALGIIELANSKGVLSSDVILEDCYHPFNSAAPVFDLTKDEVEKIAKKSGGEEILYSASSEGGDYGKYTIPGRVDSFLTTPLDQPKPIPKDEVKKLFVEKVISPHFERVLALEEYEKAVSLSQEFNLQQLMCTNHEETEHKASSHEAAQVNARSSLECLLDEDEKKSLSKEYFFDDDDCSYEEFNKVDVRQCRLWVTKRAYELGWSAELFQNDGHGTSYSRHDNDLERIGKKYQRIALDEIQARLADNFWELQSWPEEPCIYRYSDQNFRRNLEPTILPTDAIYTTSEESSESWAAEPIIKLPEVCEEKLKQWPFEEDPTQLMKEKLLRIDEEGKRWLVLYEFNIDEQEYQGPKRGMHSKRYEEFRFFYCVFVKRGKASELAKSLEARKSLDVSSFQPREYTDGPYLREAYWRNTWPTDKFSECLWDDPEGYDFAIPIANYHWESHLDKSLPNGFSNYMPQKWFADELELSMYENKPQTWQNKLGDVVIQAYKPFKRQNVVVIAEETLKSYVEQFDVEPVWVMIAERNTWPNGDNSESCWRRSEGVIWLDNGIWRQVGWNKDTKR